MWPINSIRSRLLLWIGLPFTALALLALLSSYLLLTRQINDTFDNLLLNAAQRLERRIFIADGELKINMHYFSISTLGSRGQGKIFYRIRATDGGIIAGFQGLGDPPETPDEPVFYDVMYAGNELRAVALTFPFRNGRMHRNIEVIVAESKEARYTLANDFMMTLGSLMAGTGVLAISIALFAIYRGLAPLSAVRRALSQRSPNDLKPIDEHAPHEIRPLIVSINQLMQRIKRSVESHQQLNADVSHQLRTPISEIRALAELSARNPQASDTPGNLAEIERIAEQAGHTVQQLLKYAKTRHELFDTSHLEAVDLVAIGQQACTNTATRIYQRDQELAFDAPDTLPRVLGDPIMLRWMVTNLLENASLHAGGGEPYRGSITLSLESDPTQVRLAVSDNGVGVDEEQRERLTERFYRQRQDQVGSGLGLAIVEQVATTHGARLSLTNRPEGGLEVAVAFKALPADDEQPTAG